jgi:hypothetical protein
MNQNSNPQNLNTVTFSQIVDNEFDITETYWHPDMGGLVPELIHATETIDPWIPGLRQIMEQNLKQSGQTVGAPALLRRDEWANIESQWFWDNYIRHLQNSNIMW